MTEPSRPVTTSAPDDGPSPRGAAEPVGTPGLPADPAGLVAELDDLRQALLRERGRAEQSEWEARRARHREELAAARLTAIEQSRAFLVSRKLTRLGARLRGRRR